MCERPAVASAAALAVLKADTFIDTYGAANDPAELAAHLVRAFAVDVVSAELLDSRCDTTRVLDDGRPAGYVEVNRGTAQTVPGLSEGLEIEHLYVCASHHGRGLGGQPRFRDREGTGRGLTYLVLGVWERNSNARSLYRRRGSVEFDEHVFHFGTERQREVLMRLDFVSS